MMMDIILRGKAHFYARMADHWFSMVNTKIGPLTALEKEYVKAGMDCLEVSHKCLMDDRCSIPQWAKETELRNHQHALEVARSLGC